jgi:predicted restriction endonuclease
MSDPRSKNLNDKQKTKEWIEAHPQAATVFESVNKYLKSRYTGMDHGYTEDGVKYRFNRKPAKRIRVEGQVKFTTVTMFSDEDVTNTPIKIENKKFAEEEYKQQIFQRIDNFLIENKISGFDYNLQFEQENAQAIIDDVDSFIDSIPEDIQGTEREALIKIRIGQSKFRDGLIKYWDSKCSVTECVITRILIASHIKPWRDCNDDADAKLDVMNGLLLIPNLDALFDKGFISFDDNGNIIIYSQLSEDDQKRLGVNKDMVLRKTLSERHKIYLEHHRKNIFQK